MERRRLLDINGIPFWEDCVFYAPLVQGDTTDHISGTNITVNNNYASLTYDSIEAAYLFNATTAGYYSKFYWDNLNLGIIHEDRTDNVYTVLCEMKIVSATQKAQLRALPIAGILNGRSNYVFGFFSDLRTFYGVTSTTGNIPDGGVWRKYAIVKNFGLTDSCTYYVDLTAGSVNTGYCEKSSSLTFQDANRRVTVMSDYNNNNQIGKVYLRNIVIYNRALTAAEIAQL